MQVESALLFETPQQIYARVYATLRPRARRPEVRVEFRRFANPNAFIRMADGVLEVRMADLLAGAPAPILEALAYILISKLFRQPVPRIYSHRYRLYLNRRDVRRAAQLLRQIRGRKYVSGPKGEFFDLEEIFEKLNLRYFHGLMARPLLGWSQRPSRTTLGHYDAAHNAIILSRVFDRAGVPRLAVEYVMFHEMLHLRYPIDHKGGRRRVHTDEFHAAEKEFESLKEAKEVLKRLALDGDIDGHGG
jgi:hypothetical protein